MEKNTGVASSHFLTAAAMMGLSRLTRKTAQVPWSGRMAAATLASGVGASSMAEEHITMASSPRKACGRWLDGRRQGPFHRLSRSAFRSCYCWLLLLVRLLLAAVAVVVAVA